MFPTADPASGASIVHPLASASGRSVHLGTGFGDDTNTLLKRAQSGLSGSAPAGPAHAFHLKLVKWADVVQVFAPPRHARGERSARGEFFVVVFCGTRSSASECSGLSSKGPRYPPAQDSSYHTDSSACNDSTRFRSIPRAAARCAVRTDTGVWTASAATRR
eukprot:542650-Rhodomonas_salina.1